MLENDNESDVDLYNNNFQNLFIVANHLIVHSRNTSKNNKILINSEEEEIKSVPPRYKKTYDFKK